MGAKDLDKQTEADLTYKQRRFVEEFNIDPTNGAAAARRAGYSIDSAREMAYQLMQHPVIKRLITDSNEKAAKSLGISRERVLQELAVIGFSDLKHILTLDEEGNTTVNMAGIPDDKSPAVQELSISTKRGQKEVKVKLADKRAALMDLAKMMGWHVDKTEVSGTVTLESLITQANRPEVIDSEEVLKLEREFDQKLLENKNAALENPEGQASEEPPNP